VLNASRRPPPTRPGLVPRARLVQRLLGFSGAPLALLVAPAGYGKTTLLAEWRDQDARSFAWLSLNDRDNDPAHFLASVARALHDIEPVEPDLLDSLSLWGPDVADVVLRQLSRTLEGRRLPFVLVLDDMHRLHAPESLQALFELIQHVRAGSQIAVASRRDPELSIGRLRAHRMIVELRAPDLAMRADEAAGLLELAGLELDDGDVAELLRRTEGWPAGLYLAALAMRDQTDKRRALKRFAGDDRIVVDYVRDELLSQLSPKEMSFLTRTSVLDRLAGPVCDAVLDRTGGATALAAMARTNLLLVPLDRRDEWYRYHPLLADVLRAELRRTEPEAEAGLHSRASAWYADHDDADRAIEHAIESGDVAQAGDLLWAHVPDFIPHGRMAAVERWLARFKDEEIRTHPSLALVAAAIRLVTGDGNELRQWTQAASVALRRDGAPERAARLEAGLAILKASGGDSGMDTMRDEAVGAYELQSDGSPWRALCGMFEGVARQLGGDADEARPVLEEAARRAAAAAPPVQTLCLAHLALAAIDEDDWDTGETRAALAVAQVERVGISEYPLETLVFAVSSLVRARRGRIEQATQDLRHSRALLTALNDFFPWYEAETRIVLARTALRLSDVTLARTLLTEAARALRHLPEVPVLDRWLKETRAQAAPGAALAGAQELSLTTAELRVLQFLPSHLSIREIAERLYVSPNTVKTHARAVYRKLDASSRAEAVVRAHEIGLLDIADAA
jgi:LuxR family transcriptional regulator, maltose regulon positive regulatory protein